jgi:hypothetical protein
MDELDAGYTGKAFVSTEGVNFRTTEDGEIIRELDLGEEVTVLGIAADPRWRRLRVGTETGFVAGRYLRLPRSERVEALLLAVRREWLRFAKGNASEKHDPYCQYVGEMWQAIGFNYDGRSKYSNGKDVPWSGAFISWVVSRAGAGYGAFKFADAHSQFVHDAIQARLLERRDRPFWGYRITQQRPAIGDIVARNRARNSYSFDHAERNSAYKSHSDVVVEARPGMIRVIGGNVGNTVSLSSFSGSDNLQEYALDEDGFIRPGQKVIALLKNRASEV